jgi:glycosyltransferase involved in cell wall biosynthesis
LRILHVVPTYLPAVRYGGPIVSVHGLCKALAKRDHDVRVFTTNVDGDSDSDVPLGQWVDLEGVRISYFKSAVGRRLYWSPGMRRRLRAEISSFDIAHLHSVFLWPTWAAAQCAYSHGVPYVLAPRGMLVRTLIQKKSNLKKRMSIALFDARALRRADAVHFTSRLELEEFEVLGLTARSSLVVPNGIDLEEPDTVPQGLRNESESPGDVVFLGRINWEKGLDRLIDALALVPSCTLTLAGGASEEARAQVESAAAMAGVTARVKLVGAVAGEEKWKLLARAKMVVLPSLSESFGNVVLEAMAVGAPVVVSEGVGVADAVRRAGAGLVCDGSPEGIAASMRTILSEPDRARAMGEAGRRIVEQEFTWDRVAARMEGAYEDIIARRRHARGNANASEKGDRARP